MARAASLRQGIVAKFQLGSFYFYRNSITVLCTFLPVCCNFYLQSDQRWLERYSFDVKGFSQRLKDLYSRYEHSIANYIACTTDS